MVCYQLKITKIVKIYGITYWSNISAFLHNLVCTISTRYYNKLRHDNTPVYI